MSRSGTVVWIGLLLVSACSGSVRTGNPDAVLENPPIFVPSGDVIGDTATDLKDVPASGHDAADVTGATDPGSHPADVQDSTSSDIPGTDPCTPATIHGLACAPNQLTAVSFAVVTLEVVGPCTGDQPVVMSTTADAEGYYSFEDVPPGDVELTFDKGAFHGYAMLNLAPGEQVELTSAGKGTQCFEASKTRIAVILGSADHIETLLDELGFTYDTFSDSSPANLSSRPAYELLTNLDELKNYDVLFINCSNTVQTIIEGAPGIVGNLQQFVADGGSLYASDWGWAYVEWPWPNAVNFKGDDKNFSKGDGKTPSNSTGPRQGPGPTLTQQENGTPPLTLTATFTDEGLVAALGKTQTTVYFDLGTWVVIDTAATDTTTHVKSNVVSGSGNWGVRPLVVSFRPTSTSGHVIFTSFHNIAQQDAGGSVEDIKAILSYLVFSL